MPPSLLITGDGSIADSSSLLHPVTNSGATVSTSTFDKGTGSIFFNGAATVTVAQHSFLDLGTKDWQFEIRVRPDDVEPGFRVLASFGPGFCPLLISQEGGSYFARLSATGTAWELGVRNLGPALAGQWSRLKVQRYGNAFLFLWNDLIMDQAIFGGALRALNGDVCLGNQRADESLWFKGYLDEIRLT
jgi:hypothetical protein